MILLVLGGFLLVFGVFVFFKKNEGETEISLLGAKLKSNNSAILLICLGALLATFGAQSLDTKAQVADPKLVRTDSVPRPGNDQQQKPDPKATPARMDVVKDQAAQLVGRWWMKETITGTEAARLLQLASSDIAAGADITVNGSAWVTFHEQEVYDAEAVISFMLRNLEGAQYDLKYRINYNGTWKLVGKQIIETISDGTVTPISELAIAANTAQPATLADFNLKSGTSRSVELVSLSDDQLVVKDPGTGQLTTWRKNNEGH